MGVNRIRLIFYCLAVGLSVTVFVLFRKSRDPYDYLWIYRPMKSIVTGNALHPGDENYGVSVVYTFVCKTEFSKNFVDSYRVNIESVIRKHVPEGKIYCIGGYKGHVPYMLAIRPVDSDSLDYLIVDRYSGFAQSKFQLWTRATPFERLGAWFDKL